MFVKPIKIPYHIKQYEACLRRLAPGSTRNEVENRFKRCMAGFRGEQSITYFLDYLPDEEFLIFHNLRLFDKIHYFQIDWLIMCSRFSLILEVKNISGKLTIDHGLWQMIREIDGQTDIFDDPVLQAERLTEQLRKWLKQRFEIPDFPVESRVVITSSAQLQIDNQKDFSIRNIIRKAYLGKELDKINQLHTKSFIHQSDLRNMGNQLFTGHNPYVVDLFTLIKSLSPKDIIKGVQCPNCGLSPMKRSLRYWRCDPCNHSSINAHLAALRDYYLLFGPNITNKQCRDFLLLDSQAVAKGILHSTGQNYYGENKGRIYQLSPDLLCNDR